MKKKQAQENLEDIDKTVISHGAFAGMTYGDVQKIVAAVRMGDIEEENIEKAIADFRKKAAKK